MLNISINSAEIILFSGLLILWASLLLGGFAFGTTNSEQTRRMPVWTRLASSFVLVAAAWIWFAILQEAQIKQLAAWIAIGMTLSFLGDIFMAHILPLEPYVLYGMLAFGLGHVAYIIGLVTVGLKLELNYPNYTILIIWWSIAVIGWYFIVFWKSKHTLLHYVALPYALLLASTVGFAHNLAIIDEAFILIAVGAGLFLLSDLILAGELFSELHFPLIGDVIWLTYGPGQMLIVSSLIFFAVVDTLVSST
jgi:YhhN-like protein